MYEGHKVIKREVICDNGCFQRTRYWLHGHIHGLQRKDVVVRFIEGYTGKETEVTHDTIIAQTEFMVRRISETGDVRNLQHLHRTFRQGEGGTRWQSLPRPLLEKESQNGRASERKGAFTATAPASLPLWRRV